MSLPKIKGSWIYCLRVMETLGRESLAVFPRFAGKKVGDDMASV